MRKLWLGAIMLFAVLGLMTVGCDKMMNPLQGDPSGRVSAASHMVCGDTTRVILYAGQTIDVGTVEVWNCSQNICVRYTTTGGWVMTETHLAIATSLGGIPQKNGNPIPGHFPYHAVHNPPVTEYTYCVPLGSWTPGTELYIAAHAVVKLLDGNGNVIQQQTGWGDGEDFPGKNWATYLRYTVQECYKDVDLPTGAVSMRGTYPGSHNTYWQFELADVPTGFDVYNGTDWNGWCAEENVYMNPGVWYTVNLYSSQDPNLSSMPRLYKNGEWDRVNWLLNHKADYPTATYGDIQAAVWYLLGVETTRPGGIAGTMADDAIANGDGYHPGPGGIVAVLMLDGPNTQLVFIEVDP